MGGEGSVDVVLSLVEVRLGVFLLETYGVWEEGSKKLNSVTIDLITSRCSIHMDSFLVSYYVIY